MCVCAAAAAAAVVVVVVVVVVVLVVVVVVYAFTHCGGSCQSRTRSRSRSRSHSPCSKYRLSSSMMALIISHPRAVSLGRAQGPGRGGCTAVYASKYGLSIQHVGPNHLGLCSNMDCPFSVSALITSDCVQTWTVLQHVGPNHLGLCSNRSTWRSPGGRRGRRRCVPSLSTRQIWTALQHVSPNHLGLWLISGADAGLSGALPQKPRLRGLRDDAVRSLMFI